MTLVTEISHIKVKNRRKPGNQQTPGPALQAKKSFLPTENEPINPSNAREIFSDPYSTNISFGVQGYKKKRICLEAYMREVSKFEMPGTQYLKRYIHHQYRLNLKPATIQKVIGTGKQFLTFLNKIDKGKLEELSREELEAFIEHEQDRGLSPRSVYTCLATIRAFLNYLIKEGIVDREVLARSIRVKVPDSLPRAIAPEDIERLLSVLDAPLERAMVLVLLRTGMRIGEVLNTTVKDINLRDRTILVSEENKTATGRIVYFSDDAREALKAWLKIRNGQKHFIFYTTRNHHMTYATARVRFNKLIVKAGLTNKDYSLHCLRHTFATEMLNAGMRLEVLQQILGHTSIEVTRIYARLTDKTRENEYFRAMDIIERGQNNGYYQLDPELQTILEEKKFIGKHSKKLP